MDPVIKMSRIILVLICFDIMLCIWPPPYDVDLKHEETFVIDEHLEKEDVQDVYDEEIIEANDRKQLKVQSKDGKFYRLHNSFQMNKENIYNTKFEKKRKVYEDSYPEYHGEPSEIDFVDDKGDSILQKREADANKTENELYDYNNFREEFDKKLEEKKKSNQSLVYVETTTITGTKGLLKTLTVGNATMNCSDSKKIGIEYVQCLIYDLNKPAMKTKALDRLLKIVLLALFVYLVIVLPLWCQFGWCCCCCRCKFCRPLEKIDEVKKFFATNPLGIYHDQEGRKHEFKPSVYEKYAHKKLSKALQSL